ncbi:MAG: RidA family protein [Rhodospirillaceae bacterium]
MQRKIVGSGSTLPDGTLNPISPAVRAGDLVFFSGIMPKGSDGTMISGDIRDQTKVVMGRLAQGLQEAECSFDDVVKCMVWLTHAEDFKAFNDVYAKYFSGAPPARSAVRSDLLLPGARLELEAICYKPISP